MRASERAASYFASTDEEPSNNALYEEYVRGFDEVPVLDDAVSIPPRRPAPPSFVRGERRSQRKVERPDGYTAREERMAELEQLYGEYLAPPAVKSKRKQARPRKGTGRKRQRKR